MNVDEDERASASLTGVNVTIRLVSIWTGRLNWTTVTLHSCRTFSSTLTRRSAIAEGQCDTLAETPGSSPLLLLRRSRSRPMAPFEFICYDYEIHLVCQCKIHALEFKAKSIILCTSCTDSFEKSCKNARKIKSANFLHCIVIS